MQGWFRRGRHNFSQMRMTQSLPSGFAVRETAANLPPAHRLCTFCLTLVQLPAHAVCARCPRSGRKIGRWRQPERLSVRFFRALTWAAAFSLCFVSLFWLAQKRNEASNAARSYRMNHRKMQILRQRSVSARFERGRSRGVRPLRAGVRRSVSYVGLHRLRSQNSAGLCPQRQLPAGQCEPASAPTAPAE